MRPAVSTRFSRVFSDQLHTSSILSRAASASLALALLPASTFALPGDGVVVAGDIHIGQPTNGTLNITQGSDRGIINWNGFDILNGEAVNFHQPGASSITLNRVINGHPTQILGSLTANGRIVIVNPNGVMFGLGAQVDVGSMIATTADIGNQAFMNGSLNFNIKGNPNARIINKGNITAHDGGLVALVAPSVQNDGVIQANLGEVVLASGQTFNAVDMYGDGLYSFSIGEATVQQFDDQGNPIDNVRNNGTIRANGGKVLLTAKVAGDVVSNVINNEGVIEAQSAHVGRNGEIILDGGDNGNVRVAGNLDASGKGAGQTGGKVTVKGKHIQLASATIDASGAAGGGTVKIGGDYQGGGDMPHASTVSVDADSVIDISALDNGNAGTAIIWSDNDTTFAGTVLGTGGVNGGNGGFVEVSSRDSLSFNGSVDLRSAYGELGTLLLDPTNYAVVAGFAGANQINNLVLSGLLNFGNVILSTSGVNTPGQLGDLSVNAAVAWAGIGSLTLNAHNNINVNANITSGTVGSVTMNANSDGIGGGNITFNNAAVNTGLAGNVTLNGGNVSLLGNSSITTGLGFIDINNTGTFFSTNANTLNVGALSVGGIDLNQNVGGSIQNAINAIGNSGIGGSDLVLGAGTFDEYFTIDQGNFRLTGQGQGVTIIRPTSMAGAPSVQNGPPWGGQFYNPIVLAQAPGSTILTPVTISNLTIDGSAVFSGNNAGLVFNNTNGVVNNVTINQGGAFGLYGIATSVYGHSARTLLSSGVTSQGNTWAAAALIGDNLNYISNGDTFNGTGGEEAVDISNGARATIINANITTGNHAGIAFHGAHDVNIIGGTITGSNANAAGIIDDGLAYGVAAANNVTVTGTTINNVHDGIVGIGGSNWTLTGNTMNAMVGGVGNGIQLTNMTGTNNLIANNANSFANGIRIENTDGVNVIGGILTGNTIGAYVTDSDNVAITGTTFEGGTGIRADNSNSLDVLATTMNKITGDGIDLRSSSNALIAANNINAVGFSTGYINSASGQAASGISMTYGSGNNITANLVNGFAGFGVLVNGHLNALVNTNFLNNNHVAVGLTNGANNAEVGTNITNGNDFGIVTYNTSHANIHNNLLLGIKDKGMWFIGNDGLGTTDHTVVGNIITADPSNTNGIGMLLTNANGNHIGDGTLLGANIITDFKTGMELDASADNVIDGNIINNADIGIRVLNGSHNTLIARNGILNVIEGVEIISANGTKVKTNVITARPGVLGYINPLTGQARAGVTATYANNTVADDANVITGFDNGVVINGSGSSTVSNNILTNNVIGIALTNGSSYAQVLGNLITGSTTGILTYNTSYANIIGNILLGIKGDGMYFTSNDGLGTTGHIVESNIITADAANTTGHGIFALNANGNHIGNGTLLGANIINGFKTGIELNASADNVIDGNGIFGAHTGIRVLNGSNNGYFGHNIITGVTGDGIEIVSSNNAEVDTNVITSAAGNTSVNSVTGAGGGSGVTATWSTVNVHGNIIGNFDNGRGVLINGSPFSHVDGNIINNVRDGIVFQLGSSFGTANGNLITNSFNGIVTYATSGNTIDGNTILNVGNYGIYDGIGDGSLAGTNSTITGNIITAAASNTTGSGIYFDGASNSNAGNGTLAGANVVNGFFNGVAVINGTNIDVNGNLLTDNTTGVFVDPSSGTVVQNNIIIGGVTGVHILDSNDSQVINNLITLTSGNGVRIQNSDNTLVGGNLILGIGNDGVRITGSDNVTVSNNVLGFIGNDGISANNSDNLTVTGNGLTEVIRDGIHVTNSSDLQVINNTISANGFGAQGTGRDGIHVVNSAGALIDGNAINAVGFGAQGTGRDGIHVVSSNGATVSNNQINAIFFAQGAGRDGIRVQTSDDVDILGNSIFAAVNSQGADEDGIHVIGGEDVNVDGNNLSAAGFSQIAGNNGIHVNGNAGAVINNNVFTVTGLSQGAGNDGILVQNSASAAVTNNTMSVTGLSLGAGRDAIHVNNSGTSNFFAGDGVTVTGNILTSDATSTLATRDGINVQNSGAGLFFGANAAISGNTVTGAGRDGIHAEGMLFVNLDNNIIDEAGRDGIYIDDMAVFSANGNTITDSGRDGVRITNAAVFGLDGNTIDGAAGNGITLNDVTAFTITDNLVQNAVNAGLRLIDADFGTVGGGLVTDATENDFANNGVGILADSGSSNVEISGNTFTGNAVAVNYINSGNVSILDNVITGSATGITVDNVTGLEIFRNDVSGSNTNGIIISNSDGAVLDDNNVHNGSGIGISVINSDGVFVTNNTVTDMDMGYFIDPLMNITFTGNTAANNNIGATFMNVDGGVITGNTFSNNAKVGVEFIDSNNIAMSGNSFTGNGTGALVNNTSLFTSSGDTFTGNGIGITILNSDNATLTGDIFTNNLVGVDLNNSNNVRLEELTINMTGLAPLTGTGIQITNGSTDTRVRNLIINGGNVGVLLDGAGSSMQFEDVGSKFTGQNFYFILQNGAMNGEVLDASQQSFGQGGTNKITSLAALNDAEFHTIDIQDGFFGIGDVFYGAFPSFTVFNFGEELERNGGLFRQTLFSYSGRTLTVDPNDAAPSYDVASVNLSLLGTGGSNSNATSGGGTSGAFNVASSTNPADLSNLAPAAGGSTPQELSALAPEAGPGAASASCGSNFLDQGYTPNFNAGTCSAQ